MEGEENLVKKKTHRRKAGGKRKKDKILAENSKEQDCSVGNSSTIQPEALPDESEPPRKHFKMMPKHPLLHPRKFTAQTRRLLRPSKVPKAPQNSTQFIIDDHENSAYFIDFDKGFTSPGTREEVGWSPYFQQDFENVYRTTKEAEAIDWTHDVLVERITSLEERVKTLEQQLGLCDPNMYMSQVQHRIVCMHDENRGVKEFRVWCPMHGKKVSFHHDSTSESSSEDSTSSSAQSQDDSDDSDEETVRNGETVSSDSEVSEDELNPSDNTVVSKTMDRTEESVVDESVDELKNSERTESGQSVEETVAEGS